MRKWFLIVLSVVMLLSGCSKAPAPSEDKQVQAGQVMQENPSDAESAEFLDKIANSDARPIAVMVDNDDENARPQAGLEDAYLIYEIVVEGGATRFMALYKNADTAKIGPVRSSRHYFLDYVMENGAIYTHYGWSPKALEDIPAYGIQNINGTEGSDSGAFWRDSTYTSGWHTAYTSIEKMEAQISAKGYNTETTREVGLVYSDSVSAPQAGESANSITLRYSGAYTTGYTYNAEKCVYEKSINNRPHKMQSGTVLETKNIIVLLVSDSDLGDGSARRNVHTTGNGKGYYISCGVAEEIRWAKRARNENTVYTKADGTPLEINPGKTIVNIISPAIGVVME